MDTKIYSFDPVIDERCRVMILGTMPGVESLRKQQYYGHKQNSFWKIVYSLFDSVPVENYEERKKFLLEHRIALWDVLRACEREGSSDANIRNPVPNDFEYLFKRFTGIERVYFNGEPARLLFNRHVRKNIPVGGLKFCTLPSTSPANTMKFEDKLMYWKLIRYQLEGLNGRELQRIEAGVGPSFHVTFDINRRAAECKYRKPGCSSPIVIEKELTENELIDFIHDLYESRLFSRSRLSGRKGSLSFDACPADTDGRYINVYFQDRVFISCGEEIVPAAWNAFCRAAAELFGRDTGTWDTGTVLLGHGDGSLVPLLTLGTRGRFSCPISESPGTDADLKHAHLIHVHSYKCVGNRAPDSS